MYPAVAMLCSALHWFRRDCRSSRAMKESRVAIRKNLSHRHPLSYLTFHSLRAAAFFHRQPSHIKRIDCTLSRIKNNSMQSCFSLYESSAKEKDLYLLVYESEWTESFIQLSVMGIDRSCNFHFVRCSATTSCMSFIAAIGTTRCNWGLRLQKLHLFRISTIHHWSRDVTDFSCCTRRTSCVWERLRSRASYSCHRQRIQSRYLSTGVNVSIHTCIMFPVELPAPHLELDRTNSNENKSNCCFRCFTMPQM